MIQYLSYLFLGVLLVGGVTGCAPKLIGPTQPSGYFFSLVVYDPQIYLLVNRLSYEQLPDSTRVVVRVHNAQGQAVNGVPVDFQVEPGWSQHASLTPSHAVTQGGEAQAVFRATMTGVVRLVARVENMTRETTLIVSLPPDKPQGP